MRLRAGAGSVVLVGVLMLALPGGAAAMWPTKKAVVTHVDGPGLLTVRDGKRELALRLAGVDSPVGATPTAAAQCGADGATAALRSLIHSHPRVQYSLVRSRGADPKRLTAVRPVRDEGGRLLASVALPAHGALKLPVGEYLSDWLVDRGWARYGLATGGGVPAIRGGNVARSDASASGSASDDSSQVSTAVGGVWALCGGRTHLPAGAPVPPVAPLPWDIDARGALVRVGSVPMPTTRVPLGTLEAAFPDHDTVTTEDDTCEVWVPAAGVAFFGRLSDESAAAGAIGAQTDCATTTMFNASTVRLGVPVLQGGKTGDASTAFEAANPAAHLASNSVNGLDGGLFFGPYDLSSGKSIPPGLVRGDASQLDTDTIDELAAIWL